MDVQGKTVCVTGKFNDISRKEIELALAQRGAKIAKSVTGKTEILIAGERAGSKMAKAKQMGIEIVDEAALLLALKKEATVEVAAPKPKTVTVPEGYSKRAEELFKDRNVCMTGKLNTFTRAELKALIVSAGGKVTSSPNSKTDTMISGYKWGSKLRDAIHHDAGIWSEGELLLLLEGDDGSFPKPKDVPNGENLSKLDAIEEGQTKINTPGERGGELVLKWKKVAFKPHQRFLELFGFEFAGDHQFVGKLYYDGEELQPAPLYGDIYGSESWHRSLFWEDGSDFDDQSLIHDGKHGFNCSALSLNRKRLHVEWTDRGDGMWMADISGEGSWYGDVCSDNLNAWYMVNLDKKLWGVVYHTGPYIIRSENPYGH